MREARGGHDWEELGLSRMGIPLQDFECRRCGKEMCALDLAWLEAFDFPEDDCARTSADQVVNAIRREEAGRCAYLNQDLRWCSLPKYHDGPCR